MSTIDYQLLAALDLLEAESMHIMREVAAEFERPVLLFSAGQDSIVMLRLAEKASAPPFPSCTSTRRNFHERSCSATAVPPSSAPADRRLGRGGQQGDQRGQP